MMEKYWLTERNCTDGKLRDIVARKIDINQQELEKKIESYNKDATVYTHELITGSLTIEIARLAMKWKSDKALEDIARDLDYISDEFAGVRCDIENAIDEQLSKKRLDKINALERKLKESNQHIIELLEWSTIDNEVKHVWENAEKFLAK